MNDRFTENYDRRPDAAMAHQTETPPPISQINSGDLLQGAREVRIRHGEETYRLRATSKGKLLLTK